MKGFPQNNWPLMLGLTAVIIIVSFWLPPRSGSAQQYIEPGEAAPNGPVAPPLTSGTSEQRKAGSLIIGPDGGSNVLCLNATGLSDTDNCISSWAALTANLGGPFVSLKQTTHFVDENGNPSALDNQTYQSQSGFARIRSSGNNQAFSTLVRAASYCIDQDFNIPCAEGGFGNCRCQLSGDPCRSNVDCNQTDDPLNNWIPSLTTGLFASDSYSSGGRVNDAAVFGGRVLVGGSVPRNISRLCLNGVGDFGDPNDPNCITSWYELTGGAVSGYIKLQSNPPTEEQAGKASVSGVGQISTVIAGDPATIKVSDRPYTCGDGLCSTAYESAASCPVDCAAVPQIQLSGFWGDFGTEFTAQIGGTTFPVQFLIVRAQGASISFTPQLGRVYFTNQLIGNIRVVYASQENVQSPLTPIDNPGLCGVQYTYAAFQGNLFPRYGQASAPFTVTSCSS